MFIRYKENCWKLVYVGLKTQDVNLVDFGVDISDDEARELVQGAIDFIENEFGLQDMDDNLNVQVKINNFKF